jgi:hypothetical protein
MARWSSVVRRLAVKHARVRMEVIPNMTEGTISNTVYNVRSAVDSLGWDCFKR